MIRKRASALRYTYIVFFFFARGRYVIGYAETDVYSASLDVTYGVD
jgi:hypothetical protein